MVNWIQEVLGIQNALIGMGIAAPGGKMTSHGIGQSVARLNIHIRGCNVNLNIEL